MLFRSAFLRTSPQLLTRFPRAMSLSTVSTTAASASVGPYSQAISAPPFLYTSGCMPIDAATGSIVPGGVEEQTQQVLKNLGEVIKAGGSDFSKVVKTTVFIKNMNDFQKINAVYAKVFGDHRPARTCVEVARLPMDVLVEIEAVALISKTA
ncbi:YjgF-like protein [Gautieria morchelliformis]|nr:YjgF-like protein [Gautieria morchelliformis]